MSNYDKFIAAVYGTTDANNNGYVQAILLLNTFVFQSELNPTKIILKSHLIFYSCLYIYNNSSIIERSKIFFYLQPNELGH